LFKSFASIKEKGTEVPKNQEETYRNGLIDVAVTHTAGVNL